MPSVNRILSIRISGKQRKERISNLLYSLAQFRNLLIIFNQIYNKTYGRYILNESYLYALLSDRPYTPKGENKENKLKEFTEIQYIIQTLIKQLIKDYKSYFKSLEKYKEQPNKFKGKPKPPKAKKLKDTKTFTAQLNTNTFKMIDKTHLLITPTFDKEKKYLKVKPPKEIKSVRIKFIANDVYVDVVYKKEIKLEDIERKHKAGIDIGINNLLIILSKKEEIKEKIEQLLQGKRIKRGLFKCYITGKVFNADAVGSFNILRKEAEPLIDEKTLIDKLSRPVKVRINQLTKVTCAFLLGITGRKTSWAYCKVVVGFLQYFDSIFIPIATCKCASKKQVKREKKWIPSRVYRNSLELTGKNGKTKIEALSD